MRKILLIIVLLGLTILMGCVEDNQDNGPYKYDLTLDNAPDFLVIKVVDLKVVMENYIQYTVQIDINIDDDEGEPSNLLLIAFEIDLNINLSFDDLNMEKVYIKDNFTLGSGAEIYDKEIKVSKQVSFLDYSLEEYEIFFDSIEWIKASGHIILNEKI